MHLCVQETTEHASCFVRGERTELETRGWVARMEPAIAYVEADQLVRLDPPDEPRPDALPFEAVELAPLTLGVSCARDASGRVACDSFEGQRDFRTVQLDGAPLVAASIIATDRTLLALDAAGHLVCTGRACERLAEERRALAQGAHPSTRADSDPGLGTGTPWPVGPDVSPASVIDDHVVRVRTDGLSAVCIEDAAHHIACHGDAYAPVVEADGAGALDFATAANVLCLLHGPVETAQLDCRYDDGAGSTTSVLSAQTPGAVHLHARGTTLCVEAAGNLSCTELRGRSPAAPLVGLALH